MMSWCDNKDFGLFIIRLSVAIMFISAGWGKFTNMEQTVGFFASLGLPAFITYLVVAVELLGGLAMLLGVFTRYAGILLSVVMVFAIILVKSKMGFIPAQIDIMLLASSLGIAMIGPGGWSLARKMRNSACDNCATCMNGCSGHE